MTTPPPSLLHSPVVTTVIFGVLSILPLRALLRQTIFRRKRGILRGGRYTQADPTLHHTTTRCYVFNVYITSLGRRLWEGLLVRPIRYMYNKDLTQHQRNNYTLLTRRRVSFEEHEMHLSATNTVSPRRGGQPVRNTAIAHRKPTPTPKSFTQPRLDTTPPDGRPSRVDKENAPPPTITTTITTTHHDHDEHGHPSLLAQAPQSLIPHAMTQPAPTSLFARPFHPDLLLPYTRPSLSTILQQHATKNNHNKRKLMDTNASTPRKRLALTRAHRLYQRTRTVGTKRRRDELYQEFDRTRTTKRPAPGNAPICTTTTTATSTTQSDLEDQKPAAAAAAAAAATTTTTTTTTNTGFTPVAPASRDTTPTPSSAPTDKGQTPLPLTFGSNAPKPTVTLETASKTALSDSDTTNEPTRNLLSKEPNPSFPTGTAQSTSAPLVAEPQKPSFQFGAPLGAPNLNLAPSPALGAPPATAAAMPPSFGAPNLSGFGAPPAGPSFSAPPPIPATTNSVAPPAAARRRAAARQRVRRLG